MDFIGPQLKKNILIFIRRIIENKSYYNCINSIIRTYYPFWIIKSKI